MSVCTLTEINVVTLVTREASGFYTVQSELQYKVTKEDKDAHFSCKVSYFVPGDVRTSASQPINITVHCEHLIYHSHSPVLLYSLHIINAAYV